MLVRDFPKQVILVKFLDKLVNLADAVLPIRQLLTLLLGLLLALNLKLLLQLFEQFCLVQLKKMLEVGQHNLFQAVFPNVMGIFASLNFSGISRALVVVEVDVAFLLGTKVVLVATSMAEDQNCEEVFVAIFESPISSNSFLSSHFLNHIKGFLVDNGRMGVFENQPLIFGNGHSLAIFERLLAGLQAHSMPQVFLPIKNDFQRGTPLNVFRIALGQTFQAIFLSLLVGGRNLALVQPVGDLR